MLDYLRFRVGPSKIPKRRGFRSKKGPFWCLRAMFSTPKMCGLMQVWTTSDDLMGCRKRAVPIQERGAQIPGSEETVLQLHRTIREEL